MNKNTTSGRGLLHLLKLMFFLLAPFSQAQDFTYSTNNGTIAITGYTGPGGAVTIPGSYGVGAQYR